MGNSTKTLQSVVDFASTIGDLTPVLKGTGGFSREPAVSIANRVLQELIAERFNWKWNRLPIMPFAINSLQQDYATINVTNIGWLERCTRIDINNTSEPKPTAQVEVVRDLDITGNVYGWPGQISWLQNSLLQQGNWPGAGKVYANPIGGIGMPQNGHTNILDANGNILVLTQWGTTGSIAPVAPASSVAGTNVQDGTVVWTVANPNAQGLRLSPRPPQNGNVWLLKPFVQAKAPVLTALSQTIDPVPDDYGGYFEDGFIAYCHRQSSDPKVKALFPEMYKLWQKAIMDAAKQGDREPEGAGWYPTRSIMADSGGGMPLGPAWPFGYRSIG
jgi:hypothetical protein